jgi:hypothetical protein
MTMTPRVCARLVAAGVLAAAVATPVAASAHTFPETRTVVAQLEADTLVVLVGYQPGSGGEGVAMIAHAAEQPKGLGSHVLRAVLAARAVSPIAISVDGVRLVPRTAASKLFVDPPGSDRLAVAVMLTYDLRPGEADLALGIADPRARVSWVNHGACARGSSEVWKPRSYVSGVASILLKLAPCEPPSSPPGSSSSRPRPQAATGSSTPTSPPTASRRSSGSPRPSAARSSATSSSSSSPAR